MLYFSASGGFSPGHCPASNDSIPWISESWTPENEPLFKSNAANSTSVSPPYMIYQPYQPSEAQVQTFRNMTNAFCEENNAVSRFSGGLGAYKGVAAHGFSVWSSSKALCQNDLKGGTGCNALEIMGDCQGKFGGVHWMTKEASTYGHGGKVLSRQPD